MLEGFDERVKRLAAVDVGLIKLTVFFATIIIVKMFRQLLNMDYVTLIILMLACAAKPFYAAWMKK